MIKNEDEAQDFISETVNRNDKDYLFEIAIAILIFLPICVYGLVMIPLKKAVELYEHITGKDLIDQNLRKGW